MAILNKESLERLKQKVDILDFLSSYLEIKRAGAYHKANCPFHDEKTPSFIIQPATSTYHCFGCGAHGDAIAFLMQKQHLTFIEACEHLANRYQVLLEYDQTENSSIDKKRYLELLGQASNFYQQHLLTSQEGKEALEYLSNRQIDEKFIKDFKIGLSPREGKSFVSYMLSQKYTLEELGEVGLLNQYNSAFFFDRIMFPICNPSGSVIAFSARVYKEKSTGGKYINSKESFLFKKSHVLYGLNYSRMRIAKNKRVLIVEGQIDALRLIHLGLNASVAPLGTALTEAHVDKLKQLGVEEAYLAFDSDSAGENAAVKSGQLLQKKNITTYIVPMPPNSDPDSFLREKGAKAFGELIAKKISYLSFLMHTFSTRVDLNDPANKARIVEKVAQRIKEWEDPVMVFESLKKLASIMQLPESTLGLSEISTPHIYTQNRVSLRSNEKEKYSYLETDFLTWLLQPGLPTENFFKIAEKNIDLSFFVDPKCKNIYEILLKSYKEKNLSDILSILINSPDDETQTLITDLMQKKVKKEDSKELFLQALQTLLDRKWMNLTEEIKVKIQSGLLSDEEALNFAKEFDKLKKERPKIQV